MGLKKPGGVDAAVREGHRAASGPKACGEGAVQLLRVVPEGSRPMEGSAFAAGLRLQVGDAL